MSDDTTLHDPTLAALARATTIADAINDAMHYLELARMGESDSDLSEAIAWFEEVVTLLKTEAGKGRIGFSLPEVFCESAGKGWTVRP